MNRAPPSAIVSPPTLEEVIALVRRISGDHKTPINAGTRLEEDLHITGDDGVELLGLDRLCRWLRNEPEPVVADLSVGKLHRIVVACKSQHCAK